MRDRLRRAWLWLVPSIVAAMTASLGGALIEGLVHGSGPSSVAIGAGEGVAAAAPVLALVLVALRACWWGWRPLIANASGARILAGLATASAAIVLVFVIGFLAATLGGRITKLAWFAALVAAAGAAAAAMLALALAPIAMRAGTTLVERVRPALSPQRAWKVAAIVAATIVLGAWLSLRSFLARYELGVGAYLVGVAAGATLAGAALVYLRAALSWLGAGAILVSVAVWTIARFVIASQPTALIGAWSALPATGQLIELRRDINELRGRVLAALPDLASTTTVHPDILIITVDALRADRVTPALMPSIAELASGAAAFERAYAPSTVTRGSVPSIMTSLTPGRLRGRLIDFALKLDPRHVLLAERLRKAGYATRGFLCCAHHFAGPFDLGLDRGLDRVVYDTSGDHLAQAAQTFFSDTSLDDKPRFAWLHTYEPHLWSTAYPVGIYGSAPGPRYDRAIASVDRALAPLLAAIRSRGRPTIIVFTSDHGEGLGDHGTLTHAGVPHTSQIHVPLLITAPGRPPHRVATPVSLVGLGETVLTLAGFKAPSGDVPGFADLVSGSEGGDDGGIYSVVLGDRLIPFTAHSLVAGDYHLIEVGGRAPELYDLRTDPEELTNLASRDLARLAELQRRLAERRAADRKPPF